eukprot:3059639-Prorocentrum_lima.AAC.1
MVQDHVLVVRDEGCVAEFLLDRLRRALLTPFASRPCRDWDLRVIAMQREYFMDSDERRIKFSVLRPVDPPVVKLDGNRTDDGHFMNGLDIHVSSSPPEAYVRYAVGEQAT